VGAGVCSSAVLTMTKPQLTKKKITEKIRHHPGCVQNICQSPQYIHNTNAPRWKASQSASV
jgi:hypothetical protein